MGQTPWRGMGLLRKCCGRQHSFGRAEIERVTNRLIVVFVVDSTMPSSGHFAQFTQDRRRGGHRR
jgi:hypothetical protein